jgi:hypothetical protein
MTKAAIDTSYIDHRAIDDEVYPALARYVEDGGQLQVKKTGGLWYVTVINGTSPGLSVTLASRDLAYALRQADTVSGSWVMV